MQSHRSNDSIYTWQDGTTFERPKWGIYRSLINSDDLQDEDVLFNNFSIEETDPYKDSVTLNNIDPKDYDSVQLFDSSGKEIPISKRTIKNLKGMIE
ncbi:hypothetical protein [Winogradskyella thalassocola]|uniref:hypothetical protein n=1 Tax=Winogradskyella thalassocola TaxID=262004 RepID=UPI000B89D8A4|nr:hypothetical protein [Winogradskyella thalassocola]